MSLDLETLALIAAAVNKPLRVSLDVNDFHPSKKSLVAALKDGVAREHRNSIKRWLTDQGIDWDGKTDIGESVVASLKELKRRRRARTALEAMVAKLRYPAIAGPRGVEEATRLAESIQGVISGVVQPNNNHGQRDS